jgi:hypothetical protein
LSEGIGGSRGGVYITHTESYAAGAVAWNNRGWGELKHDGFGEEKTKRYALT